MFEIGSEHDESSLGLVQHISIVAASRHIFRQVAVDVDVDVLSAVLFTARCEYMHCCAALFGMISRSSSRGGDVRPTGVSDPAAGRAGSTIILPSPRELEMVRSHNSQIVPGVAPAQAYVPSPLGSMGGLAQAVINRVRGVRAGQDSPRADGSRRSMSLLSRSGFRRDSCPTTPLAGVGSVQDPSSSFGMHPTMECTVTFLSLAYH